MPWRGSSGSAHQRSDRGSSSRASVMSRVSCFSSIRNPYAGFCLRDQSPRDSRQPGSAARDRLTVTRDGPYYLEGHEKR